MLYRLIITKVKKDYYLGTSFNGIKYKVHSNNHIGTYKVGYDVSFYANKKVGFFKDTLIPISDEEAGVRLLNNL